jgi:hypothetical protein
MSIKRAAPFFVAGYMFGGVIVEILARIHDDSWMSGIAMLGLSLPVTTMYFFALWAIGKWQPLTPSSAGMALSGFVSAFYPTFCGYFPVYFARLKFAVPLATFQFGVLVAVTVILSRFQKRSV